MIVGPKSKLSNSEMGNFIIVKFIYSLQLLGKLSTNFITTKYYYAKAAFKTNVTDFLLQVY